MMLVLICHFGSTRPCATIPAGWFAAGTKFVNRDDDGDLINVRFRINVRFGLLCTSKSVISEVREVS